MPNAIAGFPMWPTPWLSVLVPAYNAKAYLSECVESVLAQGVEGVELIVLDDCSRDETPALLETLQKRWSGALQVQTHARNQGLSAARNTLLDHARGEYVWFLDSDDKLLPGVIAELQALIAKESPDLVMCDFEVLRENREAKHWLRGEHHRTSFLGPRAVLLQDPASLLSGLLFAGQLHAWSKVSRRSLWQEELRFPRGQYFEDMATMSLLALRAQSGYYVPRPWVAYRQHDSSILANANWKKALDQSRALIPLHRALQRHACGASPQVQLALAHQSARNLIGAMRYLAAQASRPEEAAQLPLLAEQLRKNFQESSPLSAVALGRAYLRRGWLARRHKFLRWYAAFSA